MYFVRLRCLFITSFLFSYGLQHPNKAAAEDRIRSNLNDGVNAAALLGGILGVEIPPGSHEGGEYTNSLQHIQLRLQTYGVATSFRSLSYDELASFNLPCVVPLRFTNAEKTSFCVFLQANESEVHLIAAGPLMTRAMSVDDFRRHWIGYAVFGTVTNSNYGELLAWGLLGSGLPLSGYGLYTYACRWRRLSAQHT